MEDITKPCVVTRIYKMTGNYGTFEITKNQTITGTSDWQEEDWEEECYSWTGIMTTLEVGGNWTFTQAPEGEDWEIERVI